MQVPELEARVAGLLAEGWGRRVISARRVEQGMNSVSVAVELDIGDFVVKRVPDREAAALDAGGSVARRLADRGLRTGAPLPTHDGALSWPDGVGGRVSVLELVPGPPLEGTSERDAHRMAEVLASVHRKDRTIAPTRFLDDLESDVRDIEPWIRPAVEAVMHEQRRLPPVTHATLHTDPSPEAFRVDATGRVGLIDWTGAGVGPVLYDLASAVMYLEEAGLTDAFLDAYLAAVPELRAEVSAHLAAFLRFRGAVQAAYFSGRVERDDEPENRAGLRHARAMLARHGVAV